MRIQLPTSSFPITRLLIDTPLGQTKVDVAKGEPHFDYDIPEGVCIDDIGVRYEFFGNGRTPIDGGVLKVAAPPTPVAAPVVIPVVDIPMDGPTHGPIVPTGDCGCGPTEACSQCDPEDEIAEPKGESADQ